MSLVGCGPGGPGPCDAFCACVADVQCPTATPYCDTVSGTCSVCVPTEQSCPKDQLCVKQSGTYSCSATCLADSDCPKSDAGAASACCLGVCTDIQNDSGHCGACGTACPKQAHAASICAAGKCALGDCEKGFGDCDKTVANGCEVDLTSSADNCSACGKPCGKAANGMSTCAASVCGVACGMGFANCDQILDNGCETNTQTDGKNCGACGSLCGPLANASAVCTAGACNVMACNAGFGDCNMKPADGCEVNTQTDPMNCNACGMACTLPNAVATCTKGACTVGMCNAGYADCNGMAADGCETSLLVDTNNCGACKNQCVGANATEACKAGACAITACTKGWSDCDMSAKTGCEVNSDKDVLNCGACGTRCGAIANGLPGCALGVCGVGSCMAPFSDCNKDSKDGCEADLTTPATCGACGVNCAPLANAAPACTMAACGLGKCNAGFADCDMMAMNGCEVNTNTDVKNCGGCAKACAVANGTAGCAVGACTVAACNVGYGDCNKVAADGCEVNTTTDPKNCGACGTVCPNNLPVCKAGVCAVAGQDFGPNHTFVGQTTDFFLSTGQGCCSVGCNGNQAVDAAYFCLHFYGTPLGLNCTVTSAGTQVNAAAASGWMMHKNGGCTSSGTDIPNLVCDTGACKMWNTGGQAYGGLKGIICHCQ